MARSIGLPLASRISRYESRSLPRRRAFTSKTSCSPFRGVEAIAIFGAGFVDAAVHRHRNGDGAALRLDFGLRAQRYAHGVEGVLRAKRQRVFRIGRRLAVDFEFCRSMIAVERQDRRSEPARTPSGNAPRASGNSPTMMR